MSNGVGFNACYMLTRNGTTPMKRPEFNATVSGPLTNSFRDFKLLSTVLYCDDAVHTKKDDSDVRGCRFASRTEPMRDCKPTTEYTNRLHDDLANKGVTFINDHSKLYKSLALLIEETLNNHTKFVDGSYPREEEAENIFKLELRKLTKAWIKWFTTNNLDFVIIPMCGTEGGGAATHTDLDIWKPNDEFLWCHFGNIVGLSSFSVLIPDTEKHVVQVIFKSEKIEDKRRMLKLAEMVEGVI